MQRLLQSPAARIALLALTLGLLFLGQRGIWDPDEGRYSNVALHMLDDGASSMKNHVPRNATHAARFHASAVAIAAAESTIKPGTPRRP